MALNVLSDDVLVEGSRIARIVAPEIFEGVSPITSEILVTIHLQMLNSRVSRVPPATCAATATLRRLTMAVSDPEPAIFDKPIGIATRICLRLEFDPNRFLLFPWNLLPLRQFDMRKYTLKRAESMFQKHYAVFTKNGPQTAVRSKHFDGSRVSPHTGKLSCLRQASRSCRTSKISRRAGWKVFVFLPTA